MTVFCITILRMRCRFTEKKICFGALALKKGQAVAMDVKSSVKICGTDVRVVTNFSFVTNPQTTKICAQVPARNSRAFAPSSNTTTK